MLDYQNKFSRILTRMNKDLSDLREYLSDLKQNYIKLEPELSIATEVNNKLKKHRVSLELQCWSNFQYKLVISLTELTKKIGSIQPSIFLENWMLKSSPRKRIVTGYRKRDQMCNHHILKTKRCKQNSSLEEKLERNRCDFTSPVIINDSLNQYCKILWWNWKKLLTNKFIHCIKSIQIRSFFWSAFGHFSRSDWIMLVIKQIY